jgi:N-acetylated-alpha-linked acidic dipeptidase
MRSLLPLLSLTGIASGCQRDFNPPKHSHRKPLVRREQQWPPVLSKHETILVNSFDNNTIDDWSNYYGHEVKLAGLGKDAAEWTRDRWAENGVDASLSEYHVFLSYPQRQSLAVSYANGTTAPVKIQEDALPEDDVTGSPDSIPTFHGYSASGNVTAEYVYVG